MLAALFTQLNNAASAAADALPASEGGLDLSSPAPSHDHSPVSLTGMSFDRKSFGSRDEVLTRFMEEMNVQTLSAQQQNTQNVRPVGNALGAQPLSSIEREQSNSTLERASSLQNDRRSAEFESPLVAAHSRPRAEQLERRVPPSVEPSGEHAVNEAELQHRLGSGAPQRRSS